MNANCSPQAGQFLVIARSASDEAVPPDAVNTGRSGTPTPESKTAIVSVIPGLRLSARPGNDEIKDRFASHSQ